MKFLSIPKFEVLYLVMNSTSYPLSSLCSIIILHDKAFVLIMSFDVLLRECFICMISFGDYKLIRYLVFYAYASKRPQWYGPTTTRNLVVNLLSHHSINLSSSSSYSRLYISPIINDTPSNSTDKGWHL